MHAYTVWIWERVTPALRASGLASMPLSVASSTSALHRPGSRALQQFFAQDTRVADSLLHAHAKTHSHPASSPEPGKPSSPLAALQQADVAPDWQEDRRDSRAVHARSTVRAADQTRTHVS